MKDKCISILSIKMNILDYEHDLELGLQELSEESRKAVSEDGAEEICLGSAGMVKFANGLEKELGVSIFDGVTAAVKLMESLVDLGKKTSNASTYKYPEKRNTKAIHAFSHKSFPVNWH